VSLKPDELLYKHLDVIRMLLFKDPNAENAMKKGVNHSNSFGNNFSLNVFERKNFFEKKQKQLFGHRIGNLPGRLYPKRVFPVASKL
jgi:hypothetical protein